MEDIKIGEYVRTKQGNIFIYDDGEETEKILAKEIRIGTVCIVKHSHNIIDLIEVGDYVNGYKVTKPKYQYSNKYFIDFEEDIDAGSGYGYQLLVKDIKTILTKEQYESMAYKVEEE